MASKLQSHTISNIMSQHMNFTGQRADKIRVVGAEVNENGSIVKDVERYTIECDECGEVGRYDDRGDIICDGCGMMLGGEPVIPTEHGPNPDNDDGGDNSDMGGLSRGVGVVDTPPLYEPSERFRDH